MIAHLRTAVIVIGALAHLPMAASAQPFASESETQIKGKNIGAGRDRAANAPRSEHDQALVNGWPLYRTERGQAAFNDAMATLRATEGAAPPVSAFRGCRDLNCSLTLPAANGDGWVAAGRVWVSPEAYVLFVHSPRGRMMRRRSVMNMQYFVFHEFHNGTRNTDTFDTISSHAGGVFVPFYMSKQNIDAAGRAFVMVVQVAPYDVVSVHASNMGSAGPGMEVAKNASDVLDPLQGLAGVLVAEVVKTAVPRLRVVNHRGSEGLAMLNVYQRRLAAIGRQGPAVALPFTPAPAQRVANAAVSRLAEVMWRRGSSPPIAVAERGFLPRARAVAAGLKGIAMPSLASSLLASDGSLQLLELPRPVPRPEQVPDPRLPAVRVKHKL